MEITSRARPETLSMPTIVIECVAFPTSSLGVRTRTFGFEVSLHRLDECVRISFFTTDADADSAGQTANEATIRLQRDQGQ